MEFLCDLIYSTNMNLLNTYNDNEVEPEGYMDRHTVRCVIFDEEKKKVLLFGPALIGGGVEENETDEEAVAREAMEESGIEVEIIKPLGEIISYRDGKKKKYITRGYLCKFVRKVCEPTTILPGEQGIATDWFDIGETIARFEKEIEEISKKGLGGDEADLFQVSLHARQVNLDLIKQALI
jgi:8-oxo-dGTP pyrophosphatase MutT (NUDIX family)